MNENEYERPPEETSAPEPVEAPADIPSVNPPTPETTPPVATPPVEAGDSPISGLPTPEDASVDIPIEGSAEENAEGQPDTPEGEEAATPQPEKSLSEKEKELAENKAREKVYFLLKTRFEMSDEDIQKELGNLSLEELFDFYTDLYPDFVNDLNTLEEAIHTVVLQEATAHAEAQAAEKEQDDTREGDDAGEEVPVEESAPEAISPEGEDDATEAKDAVTEESETPEQKSMRQAKELVQRQAAWDIYRKNHLETFIKENLVDETKYPPDKFPNGPQYEDLDDEDKAKVEAAFKEFWTQDYLPENADTEFADQDQDSLRQALKKLGKEIWVKGASTTDASTLLRTLFLQGAYHSGGHSSEAFAQDENDRGTAIDVARFREMCGWKDGEGSEDNKKKWMQLCAIIYNQLQKADNNEGEVVAVSEWTDGEALEPNEMKEHMEELYEACVTSGKEKVNRALVEAFDTTKNGGIALTKPGVLGGEVHASQELIVHFQMMANHSDYLQNFFS